MKRGFSLVELSIVLVILGLLVGGILAGKSLIRASELRSVTTDFTRYKTSAYAFRDKYLYLPGDMPNATSFWGDQATGTGSCASAATPDGSPGTCNGDGDGGIYYTTNGEPSRLWQQLAFAGIIEGSYSGIGTLDQPGVNIPMSKITAGGFAIFRMGNTGAISTTAPNRIKFGAAVTGGTSPGYAILRPEETWNIDSKIDDGNPYNGAFIAATGNSPSGTCVNGTTYTLNNDAIACIMMLNL